MRCQIRLYVRNGKIKFAKSCETIENTNGLEEHLSECTNNMSCRMEPNSTRKAKKYNLSGLSDDETYTDAQIENKVPLKILGIELVFACRG